MIDDINTKRTELANQMAAAGAAALDFNATAAVLAAIPDTEPQQYVAAGTPENIAAILPATISPQRRLRHGERPTETLVFDEPAATSGDAPDLQQLKALALAATPGPWELQLVENGGIKHLCPADADGMSILTVVHQDETPFGAVYNDSDAEFIAAANPAVVLDLIDRIERLTTIPEQEPSTEQEWAKVDPAVAFHLIERHAEDWADAGRMMEAWRAAVSAATKPTADLSALNRYSTSVISDETGLCTSESGEFVRFADVQCLLATKPAAAPSQNAILETFNYQLSIDGGDVEKAVINTVRVLADTPAASTIGAAQTAEQVRDQALEEAALAAEKVQDDYSERQGGKWPELRDDASTGAGDCATAIRALKSRTTAHGGAQGESHE